MIYAVLYAADTSFVELAAVLAMAENDARDEGAAVEIDVNHDDDTVTFRLVDIEPSDTEVSMAWQQTIEDLI